MSVNCMSAPTCIHYFVRLCIALTLCSLCLNFPDETINHLLINKLAYWSVWTFVTRIFCNLVYWCVSIFVTLCYFAYRYGWVMLNAYTETLSTNISGHTWACLLIWVNTRYTDIRSVYSRKRDIIMTCIFNNLLPCKTRREHLLVKSTIGHTVDEMNRVCQIGQSK